MAFNYISTSPRHDEIPDNMKYIFITKDYPKPTPKDGKKKCTKEQIKEYISICDELGLSALVEAHDENEVQTSLNAGARMIGVNNRNLKDFSVDTDNSRRLRKLIPDDVLFVSESGVSCAKDVAKLREIGADAVLIGETLMRASDKKARLDELRGVI